jgi:hypothetical protein
MAEFTVIANSADTLAGLAGLSYAMGASHALCVGLHPNTSHVIASETAGKYMV